MTSETPRVILAGTFRQADQWCRDHGLDPRTVTVVTSTKNAHRLFGLRFTAEQVVLVGTWDESRDGREAAHIVQSRIAASE